MINYLKYRFNEFFYGGDKISIPNNALVLDIASGGKPYWRSDVLMDKFVFDNSERDASLIIDRNFVVGDVTKLPFKDKSFDFIIARHILEHLPDPKPFFKELERVSKAGYIETPSSFCESGYGWPFHLWEIDVEENKLLMRNKKIIVGDNFQKVKKYSKSAKIFKYLFIHHRDLFFTKFYWTNKIEYKIVNDGVVDKTIASTNAGMENFSLDTYRGRYSLKTKTKNALNYFRRVLYSNKKKYELLGLLTCIDCHGEIIKRDNGNLECQKCNKKYEYKDNIPVML